MGRAGATVPHDPLFSTAGLRRPRALPATGTYTVTVDPTRSHRLRHPTALRRAAGCERIARDRRSAAVDRNDDPGQNGVTTFSANGGQSVSLTLSGLTIPSSFISVLKPDGTTLVPRTLVFSYGRTFVATAPVAGAYTVVVDPQGAATGSMTLSIS